MCSRNLNLACGFYSRDVYMSNSWPFLRLRSTGSARISTPGPTRRESDPERCDGKICIAKC